MSGIEEKSLLSLSDVLESTGGIHVLGVIDSEDDFSFTSVQTDSRLVTEKTLFVPLIGEKQDGHKYVPQAIEKGASVIFIRLKNFEENASFFTPDCKRKRSLWFTM